MQRVQTLSRNRRFLTRPDPVSMVRAVLRGAERSSSTFCTAGVGTMSDDTGGQSDPNRRLSDEAALSARLRRLGDRLDQHRASQPPEPAPDARPSADRSAMARGLRLSSELVAGVLVGAVIGYMLDRLLGLSPWGFIVFVLLGFVAGILNLMRAAGVLNNPGDRAP
jgi:ATP synthase protein I